MYTLNTKYTPYYEKAKREDERAVSTKVNRLEMPMIYEKKHKKQGPHLKCASTSFQPKTTHKMIEDMYKTTNSMTYLSPDHSPTKQRMPASPTNQSPTSPYYYSSTKNKQQTTHSPKTTTTGIMHRTSHTFGSSPSRKTSTHQEIYHSPERITYQQYHHSPHVTNRKNDGESHSPNQSEYRRLYRCDSKEWRHSLKSTNQHDFISSSNTLKTPSPPSQKKNNNLSSSSSSPPFILGNDVVDLSRRPTGVPYVPPSVIVPYQKFHPVVSSVHLGVVDDTSSSSVPLSSSSSTYGACSPSDRQKVFHDAQGLHSSTGLNKHRKFYSSLIMGSDPVVMKSMSSSSFKPFSFSSVSS